MSNSTLKNDQINQLKPLVNQFIMKYIPNGFQDQSEIENWIIKEENQAVVHGYMEENDIENEMLFMALLSGLGQYNLLINELNLINENKLGFNNVFEIDQRLNEIQVELEGNPGSIESSNIWFFGIKNGINHYVSTNGIGIYLLFETEMATHEYYDSLFESLIPAPDLPEGEPSKEDLENFLNSKPEITDPIENKVRINMQQKFYEIQNQVLERKTAEFKKQDFVVIAQYEKQQKESDELDENDNNDGFVEENLSKNDLINNQNTNENLDNNQSNSDLNKNHRSNDKITYLFKETSEKGEKENFNSNQDNEQEDENKSRNTKESKQIIEAQDKENINQDFQKQVENSINDTEQEYIDVEIVFSNKAMARRITINNFFNDVNRLAEQFKPRISLEQMKKEVVDSIKKELKQEFEQQYQQFKNNPNLEPLNKHKKPWTIKLA